jgi:hypothetical protein
MGAQLPAIGSASRHERPIEQDHDGNAPSNEDKWSDCQLGADGDCDTGIFFQEPGRERTSGDTREHCEPSVSDRQRTLMHEKCKTTNTCKKRPDPGHNAGDSKQESLQMGRLDRVVPQILAQFAMSLACRRLPKLYLVPFWIDNPGELPILGIVSLLENVAPFFA